VQIEVNTVTIATVGIIGLGTMGRGIAGVCLAAGYRVVVFDANPVALARETDRLINKAR
jgi:3-hydroxyacyl-CoA dehydrogenase